MSWLGDEMTQQIRTGVSSLPLLGYAVCVEEAFPTFSIWSRGRTSTISTCTPTPTLPTGSPAACRAHFFYLDSGKDALYSAGGAVERSSPKGNAGLHVGDELDFITNFHLNFHQDILVGYSVLFPGEFVRKTGSPATPQLLYLQYSYKW